MNREILFRGKKHFVMDDGVVWVYGFFVEHDSDGGDMIIENKGGYLEEDTESIITKTLGQFIGEIDKNGTKVFEGDVVEYENVMWEIIFSGACFCMSQIDNTVSLKHIDIKTFTWNQTTVVGNKHDNPELMKV